MLCTSMIFLSLGKGFILSHRVHTKCITDNNQCERCALISLQAEAAVKGTWNAAGSVATEDMPRKPLIAAVATQARPMGGLERSGSHPRAPWRRMASPPGEREGEN